MDAALVESRALFESISAGNASPRHFCGDSGYPADSTIQRSADNTRSQVQGLHAFKYFQHQERRTPLHKIWMLRVPRKSGPGLDTNWRISNWTTADSRFRSRQLSSPSHWSDAALHHKDRVRRRNCGYICVPEITATTDSIKRHSFLAPIALCRFIQISRMMIRRLY